MVKSALVDELNFHCVVFEPCASLCTQAYTSTSVTRQLLEFPMDASVLLEILGSLQLTNNLED